LKEEGASAVVICAVWCTFNGSQKTDSVFANDFR